MRPYSKDEPARQPPYRQLSWRLHHQVERIDDIIDFLKRRIEQLEKRLDKLERSHVKAGGHSGG